MCQMCKLLDSTFPMPKELARASKEIDWDEIHPSHLGFLEDKLDRKIAENGQDVVMYRHEYFEELEKLK